MPEPSRLSMLAIVGAIAVAIGAGVFFGRGPAPALPAPARVIEADESTIVVHVSGAVRNPGLVSLDEGSRVAGAIDAAGGATGEAHLGAINLAGEVRDGDQIAVPSFGDPAAGDEGRIDLNRSSAARLAELHGIGPVLAERIVAHREAHGPFETIEDLLDVPGIGEAKLALLRSGVSPP